MKTTLYLVRFPDGATYATGPQIHPDGRHVPGGVIAFTEYDMAFEAASVIDGGTVVSRDLNTLVDKAQTTGIPLYIRHARGTSIIEETIPELPAVTRAIRIMGDERERLLRVERKQQQKFPM